MVDWGPISISKMKIIVKQYHLENTPQSERNDRRQLLKFDRNVILTVRCTTVIYCIGQGRSGDRYLKVLMLNLMQMGR